VNLKSKNNPTYVSWRCLVGRCTNPSFGNYKSYGGVGITLNSSWLDFEKFVLDMGNRPKGKTLDRIDTTKGYSKDNCRWATPKEQQTNRKCALFLTYNGVTKNAREWARDLNLAPGAVWMRIKKHGWSVERAVTSPKGSRF